METYISLLIGLVALFAAWRSWKDVVAEATRDMLFDLRDEWRVFWTKTGRSFDEPIYAQVRERLNRHLRYTRTFRLVGLLYYSFHLDEVRRLAHAIPVLSFPEDSRIDKEIKSIADRAVDAIRGYMLLTSLLLFPVAIGVVVYMVVKKTRAVGKALQRSIEKLSSLPGLDLGFDRSVIEASSFSSDMASSRLAAA